MKTTNQLNQSTVAEVNNKEEIEMEKFIGVDVSIGVDVVEVMEFPHEGGFRILLTLPAYIVTEVDCNDSAFVIAVDYGYFIVSKFSGEIHFSPEPFSLYEEEGAEGMIDPRSLYSPSELFEMGMIDTPKGGEEMNARLDYYCYDNGEEDIFVIAEMTAPVVKDLLEIPMADVISYKISETFATVVTLDTVYSVSNTGEVHTSSC